MTDNFAHRAAQWDSADKVRMTEVFVEEMLRHVEPGKEWKVLEIGAGTGLVGLQLLPQVKEMVFEDTSAAMLEVLRSKLSTDSPVEIVCGEAYDYTADDIDLVISCMAFHHIEDTGRLLDHLAKILRPGGRVVVGDLLTEDGSFHQFEPVPHCGFDVEQLAALFSAAGLRVEVARVYHVLKRELPSGGTADYPQIILVAVKD